VVRDQELKLEDVKASHTLATVERGRGYPRKGKCRIGGERVVSGMGECVRVILLLADEKAGSQKVLVPTFFEGLSRVFLFHSKRISEQPCSNGALLFLQNKAPNVQSDIKATKCKKTRECWVKSPANVPREPVKDIKKALMTPGQNYGKDSYTIDLTGSEATY